jgi:ABC-2 type transport system permease protein
MNTALYKQGIKAGWKLLAAFAAVITMYVTIIIYMFNPETSKVLEEFSKSMPDMMAAFGMSGMGTTLTSFLVSYLFGFILLIFPMVYVILATNSLVVRHTDKGSMAYLLASPNKRGSIALTQAVNLITGIFILVAYETILAICISEAVFPGQLEISNFLALNLGLFCLQFLIGGLCFFASCISNEVKTASFIGGGISILCYLFQSLANVGDKFSNLKYASFFTLFDTKRLMQGSSEGYLMIACLFIGGLLLFTAGIISFNRRDMHV